MAETFGENGLRRGTSKGTALQIAWYKKSRPKKRGRGGGVRYDCQRTIDNRCTRSLIVETWLQKSADPCLWERPAGPEEEEGDECSLWNKNSDDYDDTSSYVLYHSSK